MYSLPVLVKIKPPRVMRFIIIIIIIIRALSVIDTGKDVQISLVDIDVSLYLKLCKSSAGLTLLGVGGGGVGD